MAKGIALNQKNCPTDEKRPTDKAYRHLLKLYVKKF
jgi:hypothetical protein